MTPCGDRDPSARRFYPYVRENPAATQRKPMLCVIGFLLSAPRLATSRQGLAHGES